MTKPLRAIAFYLPQFHPIPENDAWWGTGFTEWTNVAKARPLYPGHDQPRVPADLGFYDLRVPETRAAQAAMARAHGIHAFCYYHYWFAGRRLLERPFEEVLASGEPDFPFCLCWANQTWTGIWHGAPNRVLVEQTYPGMADHRAHFDYLLRAFRDRRYLTVDGRPLFMVYEPTGLQDALRVTGLWREWARAAGLPGLYLVGWRHVRHTWQPRDHGFDAAAGVALPTTWFEWNQPIQKLQRFVAKRMGRPVVYAYRDVMFDVTVPSASGPDYHPCLLPGWDNTPRSGRNGLVLHGSTPDLFRQQVRAVLERMPGAEQPSLLFIKAWNEWAEGNYLEPDLRFGTRYLEVLRDELGAENAARGWTEPAHST